MADIADVADLQGRFAQFGAEFAGSVPLYARLSTAVAELADVAGYLASQPTVEDRIPVLLFAAVHDLLLGQPDLELAQWYATIADTPRTDDPSAVFVATCRAHADEVRATIAARTTQTNEVGRCALFLPALATLAADPTVELGVSLVDVGTSGGLNLHLDRYSYRYSNGIELDPSDGPSSVVLECEARTPLPAFGPIPTITGRRGLDRRPIDITDPGEARWLLACVWPEQLDRFQRLQAAIAIAAPESPEIVAGDAVADLAAVVDRAAADGHPTVLNSWVLNYLSPTHRVAYVDALDQIGARRDLSWVCVESPREAPGLPWPNEPTRPEGTHVLLVTWRNGRRAVRHLAVGNPHGRSIAWLA